MRKILLVFILIGSLQVAGQELYVYTDPASNVPAKSVSFKLTGHLVTSDNIYNRFSKRFMPEINVGISKKVILRAYSTIANMHTRQLRYESVSLYAKYRFLSNDDFHKHFRMAVFADGSISNAPFHYDDISLMGDKSGVQLGLIATQLWHKFALSATISHTQVLNKSRNNRVVYVPERNYQAFNYALSGGLLVFPKDYTNYKQVNLNLYCELLGQYAFERKQNYFDIAPAIQFIFQSKSKLNIGYRFQAGGNMQRMASDSWLLSFEQTLFNAFSKHNQ